jgi:hypothetical protein
MILGELAPIRTDSVGIEQIWIHRARFHQDERHSSRPVSDRVVHIPGIRFTHVSGPCPCASPSAPALVRQHGPGPRDGGRGHERVREGLPPGVSWIAHRSA